MIANISQYTKLAHNKNHAEGVYIINAKRCISSAARRYIINSEGIVYHQGEALYIIKAQKYTLRVMIYACGDDIHAPRDDMPSLRLG